MVKIFLLLSLVVSVYSQALNLGSLLPLGDNGLDLSSLLPSVNSSLLLAADTGLSIDQLCAKYGYSLETHDNVTTEDSYILSMHRIQKSNVPTSLRPVLLAHGLISSSPDWVRVGEKSLPFLLANAGFDVWLSNARGNTFSRRHLTINPNTDPIAFFNFTFDQIGRYDRPAEIDYILKTTGEDKINYVGHSQGVTTFFVLLSEKPKYNDKIKSMAGLAPGVFFTNAPHPLAKFKGVHKLVFYVLIYVLNVQDFLPYNKMYLVLSELLCNKISPIKVVCPLLLKAAGGFSNEIGPDSIPVIFTSFPGGSATKQFLHFAQLIGEPRFSQFDYGAERNQVAYGQSTPPSYNLKNVNVPVVLYCGGKDFVVGIEDTNRLKAEVPSASGPKVIENFEHLDFLFGRDVKEELYDDLIDLFLNDL